MREICVKGFCMAMCCFSKGKLTWLLRTSHPFGIGIDKYFGPILVIYVVPTTNPTCLLGLS